MRSWPVPPDIEDTQEKFLGPLGLRQFLYAVAGFVFGCTLAALPLPLFLRIAFFAVGTLAGITMAAARPYNMSADVFLLRWWRWRRSPREFSLIGGDRD
jgi:hypothetical protein